MTLILEEPPQIAESKPAGAKQTRPAVPHKMRITPEQFELMAGAGTLPQRAELMDGEVYTMPPDGNDHSTGTTDLLRPLILNWLPPRAVRCQSTHRFAGGWMPMPDIALLDERPVRGATVDPLPRLVVEVSDTSLNFDLNDKRLRYAQQGIPEYWIAELLNRRLRVFREPVPDAESAVEAWRVEFLIEADGTVSPLCIPDLTIKVADVLPEVPAPEA